MAFDSLLILVSGNDATYSPTIKLLTAADPAATAWLTLKNSVNDADPGVLQKKVTTSNVVGTGQIVDNGSTTGVAILRFDLTNANTLALTPGNEYLYDVKVKTAGAAQYTPITGRVRLTPMVTQSTS